MPFDGSPFDTEAYESESQPRWAGLALTIGIALSLAVVLLSLGYLGYRIFLG